MLSVFGALMLGSSSYGLPEKSSPKSLTVTPRFEDIRKIDVHAHIFESIPALSEMLNRNNASIINVCNRGRDGSLQEMDRIARGMHAQHPNLYPFASSFDLTRLEEPDFSIQAVQWLDQTFREGAVMTKIWKEVGMELRRKDGSFVLPDDPVFDPIYELLTKRRKPLMAHFADPVDGWRPLDPASPHYSYFKNNPDFHFYNRPGFPTHVQIVAARDRILEKHPRLIVIGAHLGSLEHDLDALAQRLNRYPNFNVDCAARTRDLSRLDRDKVRSFFLKYQDRILYGVDMTWKPFRETRSPTEAQRAAFVRNLENRYRADFAFYTATGLVQYDARSVEALTLPPPVLDKFFHGNAERLILHSQP